MVKRIILIVAIAMIAFSGVALAADSNTVTVTANVVGTCKFNSATSTLAFGALDPSSALDVTASTTPTFWCTKNTVVTSITRNNGLHPSGTDLQMQGPTIADLILYTLTFTPSSTTGAGKTTPIDLLIEGTILNSAYINAAVGNYSDSVVVSINP